jgi:hypothetical protein
LALSGSATRLSATRTFTACSPASDLGHLADDLACSVLED